MFLVQLRISHLSLRPISEVESAFKAARCLVFLPLAPIVVNYLFEPVQIDLIDMRKDGGGE